MRRAVLAIVTLWWREITRFRRQRSRVIGSLGQPLLFWFLLGSGLRASFRPSGTPTGSNDYLEYFYPGVMALVMLFTAIFATIAIVEDRHEGFLQGVLVAPVSRSSIIIGQALGGTTLAFVQGALLLFLAPLAGIPVHFVSVLIVLTVLFCLGFGLTNLGLIIAWRMRSTQGFHAIMNMLLMPLWLLSGAFFPVAGTPGWLAWVMTFNPLTYGLAALRQGLYFSQTTAATAGPTLIPAIGITLLFGVISLYGAVQTAHRSAV